MQQLIEYFRRLTLGGNKESSKRFIALYITMFLITYCVVRFTDSNNVVIILGELITFVLTLLGIASYETIKGVNNEQR
jgi:hypothetical protein